ncbi:hypothetical protein D3C73_464390 [compost metagenome]
MKSTTRLKNQELDMKLATRFKKRIAGICLAAILTLPIGVLPASAQEANIGDLLAIRDIAESKGAKVLWDGEARVVTITKDGVSFTLTINSDAASLNGQSFSIGDKVQIVNEKTMVPASLVSRLFPADKGIWKADEFLIKILNGSYEEAEKALGPNLKGIYPAAALQQLGRALEQQTGGFGKLLSSKIEKNGVHHNVVFLYQGVRFPIEVTIRLDQAGLVDDMSFAPAQPPSAYKLPTYDQPEAYNEQEVVIGEGAFALPGILTVPKGEGPFPAVVLVHGSGPNDKDESIGGAKPFRDLAIGLAGEKIAVLRYDKVTKEHGLKVTATPNFTLQKETVDDALKAVELLKGIKGIDSAKIYVAGHSQGGMSVPKMIELDKAGVIAGGVILAGPSQSFTTILVEQQQELLARIKSVGIPTEPYEQSAALWTSIAKLVDDPQYSLDHLPESFPMPPAYWWYEQRDYVPSAVAAKQSRPLFILQGENDWQVTMNQFSVWKEALKERKNVQYKSYPDVSHLLVEFKGVSTGQEYAQAANVPLQMITDIAAWVKTTK